MILRIAAYLKFFLTITYSFTHCVGIWKYLNSLKINMVIKNQVIRYRKEIKQGDTYTVATTIIGYNDKVPPISSFVD